MHNVFTFNSKIQRAAIILFHELYELSAFNIIVTVFVTEHSIKIIVGKIEYSN